MAPSTPKNSKEKESSRKKSPERRSPRKVAGGRATTEAGPSTTSTDNTASPERPRRLPPPITTRRAKDIDTDRILGNVIKDFGKVLKSTGYNNTSSKSPKRHSPLRRHISTPISSQSADLSCAESPLTVTATQAKRVRESVQNSQYPIDTNEEEQRNNVNSPAPLKRARLTSRNGLEVPSTPPPRSLRSPTKRSEETVPNRNPKRRLVPTPTADDGEIPGPSSKPYPVRRKSPRKRAVEEAEEREDASVSPTKEPAGKKQKGQQKNDNERQRQQALPVPTVNPGRKSTSLMPPPPVPATNNNVAKTGQSSRANSNRATTATRRRTIVEPEPKNWFMFSLFHLTLIDYQHSSVVNHFLESYKIVCKENGVYPECVKNDKSPVMFRVIEKHPQRLVGSLNIFGENETDGNLINCHIKGRKLSECLNVYLQPKDIVMIFGVMTGPSQTNVTINPTLAGDKIYIMTYRDYGAEHSIRLGYDIPRLCGAASVGLESNKRVQYKYVETNNSTSVQYVVVKTQPEVPQPVDPGSGLVVAEGETAIGDHRGGFIPAGSEENVIHPPALTAANQHRQLRQEQERRSDDEIPSLDFTRGSSIPRGVTSSQARELEEVQRLIYETSDNSINRENEAVTSTNATYRDINLDAVIESGNFVQGQNRPRVKKIRGYSYKTLGELEDELKKVVNEDLENGVPARMIIPEQRCFYGVVTQIMPSRMGFVDSYYVKVADESRIGFLLRIHTSTHELRMGPPIQVGQVIRVHRVSVQTETDRSTGRKIVALSTTPHWNYAVFEIDRISGTIVFHTLAQRITLTEWDKRRVRELLAYARDHRNDPGWAESYF